MVAIAETPAHGYVSVDGGGQITYTPDMDFAGTDSFVYMICTPCGDCDMAYVYFEVEDPVDLAELLSPNDDGDNDTFIIKGVENYPDNHLEIYNRWGNLVYSKDGYLNDWDGYSNVPGKIGSGPLPVGTYYCVFNYGNNKSKVGYIYLIR